MAADIIIGSIVQGETAPFTVPLFEDGAAVNGAGLSVTDVLLTARDGTAVTTATKFAWASQGAGTVTYSPASNDFDAALGPYEIRVQLTDGNGKTRYYPNNARAFLVVWPSRG